MDISCQISVFPADNVPASAEKRTACNRHVLAVVKLSLSHIPHIELDLVTKIITQAHLLFPFDCNCTLYRGEVLQAYILYRHVLGVVKSSLSYMYMVLIELDLVTKIVTSSPEQHLLFLIDCNCML